MLGPESAHLGHWIAADDARSAPPGAHSCVVYDGGCVAVAEGHPTKRSVCIEEHEAGSVPARGLWRSRRAEMVTTHGIRTVS